MEFKKLGWDSFFDRHLAKTLENARGEYDYVTGRVSAVHTNLCQVLTEKGEITAAISGKVRDGIANDVAFTDAEVVFPAVGDWVLMIPDEKHSSGIIRVVLPRKSKFSRKAAGSVSQEQVIAANIDFAFIVASLNTDLNLSRVERYLVTAWNSGATPVILLNKADLCLNVKEKISEIEGIAPGVAINAISAINSDGLRQLDKYLTAGKTAVFIGSSGVGKSTIINRLLGSDIIKVKEISGYKDKGHHTTTSREMYLLDSGGIVIDTPGMRELQLWEGEEGLSGTFEDIERIATQCRFDDCRHQNEPDCAIRTALENGEIDRARFKSYLKLQRELKYQKSRTNTKLRMEESKRWKNIAKAARNFDKGSRYK
jgi:ribosome biogenesis GTPase